MVGASGAGKSLLLKMLADLIPHEGLCSLDGVSARDIPAPQWRMRIRYCAAEPGWWAPTIGAHFRDPAAIGQACAALGLDGALLDAAPERVSTGERQRFALLRGLEDRPAFLLLDEPSSALDETSTDLVEALLEDAMDKGMGLVLASHDKRQVARLADDILEISRS
ncbi:MAG: ATP-binding cassette domain-containing protein [Devosia sp.]|nr:ATP-binding cassette domain-containing protein [Devosia sp.]